MSRHRLTHAEPSVYTGPDVRELLLFFNALTLHQDRAAARIQNDVSRSGANFLNAAQREAFHELAANYGGQALAYAQEYPGDHDMSMTEPATLLIETAAHAGRQLAEDLGIPHRVPDHGVWAISRATLTAFAFIKIKYGHDESEKRYRRAVRAVRSLATGDVPRLTAAL
ncbi:hypothetical protein GCM10027258_92780 [Amycolatopsis stemonae]